MPNDKKVKILHYHNTHWRSDAKKIVPFSKLVIALDSILFKFTTRPLLQPGKYFSAQTQDVAAFDGAELGHEGNEAAQGVLALI